MLDVRNTLLVALLASLVACGGVSEKKLYRKLYKTTCKQAFTCDEAGSTEAWENVSGCRDAFSIEISDSLVYYSACDYQPSAARAYLKAVRALPCGAPQADIDAAMALWDDIYDCPFEETLEGYSFTSTTTATE